MERKIGEIFRYNGEWYQCMKSPDGSCKHCDMNFGGKCPIPIKECVASSRSDLSYVIFKKLEKVGEPFIGKVHIQLQRYKIYAEPIVDPIENVGYVDEGNTIAIELKQTKEDMEEKELNLKEFNLEAAKQGKPVCTKDGRKARIICFDRTDLYPIVALIECEDGKEMVGAYSKEGQTDIYEIKGTDLMMLPEKKEGWVNVYNSLGVVTFSHNPYDTKKEALANVKPKDYVDTVKISWEEQP